MRRVPTDPRAPRDTKPPGMADVARLAGVSMMTVSRVLNDHELVRPETRERVRAAIAELGYRRNTAARALATSRSGRLGMVASHLALYGPSEIAVAVQEAGHDAGYDVSIVGLAEFSVQSLRDAVDRLLAQSVEAVVVAVAHAETRAVVDDLRLPIPVVQAGGIDQGQPMAAGVDQHEGGRLATEHLLATTGRSPVAFVRGPVDWVEADQRRQGWVDAHRACGVEPGPELSGDWSAASGFAAGKRIAADPAIRSVFAANDEMALGLLRALHEEGRAIPGDVQVVGFDDTPESGYFWPPLTTVRQPFARLGRNALGLAVRALEGEHDPQVAMVAPELVVRASTTG